MQQREKKKRQKADPVATEARLCAARILLFGRSNLTADRVAAEVEASMRMYAGTAQPAPVTMPLQAERGVREIILED